MIGYLRQSTASTILVGPIVDSVDATPETAQTIAQADVKIWRRTDSAFGSKSESTACSHQSYGIYSCLLNDTSDTSLAGPLTVAIFKTGTMVWRGNYVVLPAVVYDSLVLGTDYLQGDMVQIYGSGYSAELLKTSASAMLQGTTTNTPVTATTTIFQTSSITSASADNYKGRIVLFTGGNLVYQATAITAYSLSSGQGRFTVNALTAPPDTGSTFVIV
jgi:hypothetical protein